MITSVPQVMVQKFLPISMAEFNHQCNSFTTDRSDKEGVEGRGEEVGGGGWVYHGRVNVQNYKSSGSICGGWGDAQEKVHKRSGSLLTLAAALNVIIFS